MEVPSDDPRADLVEVASVERLLGRIDAATKRIDAGSFGLCGRCAQPIGEERLAEDPAADLCASCAPDLSADSEVSPSGQDPVAPPVEGTEF